MPLDTTALDAALSTGTMGRRLVYLASTGSTMDVARAEAETGEPEGTAIFAEEQTAGRGRFGRAWHSPAGKNIYVTLILRPTGNRLRSLSMLVPLAVALALEETAALAAQIKWPNDVLIGGRKVGGILIDAELSGATPQYALVGMGVNVNFDIDPASDIAGIATSVKQELGCETPREPLLAAIFNHIERLYEAGDAESVRTAWKARLETLGREVRLNFHGEVHEGLAEDVDTDGNLVLRYADGKRQTFEAGEVSLRAT